MTPDLFTRAESAATFVLSRTALRPQIGLVLGSGLGAFADDLAEAVRIPYADIPAFPRSTAIGHAGQLVVGKSGDVPVAVMQGRAHLYEGYSADEVAFPTPVLGRMGMSTVAEAIVARHMGMNVLAISCVTNMAAGILDQALDHEEVLEVGRRVMGQFIGLLRAVLLRIAAELEKAG